VAKFKQNVPTDYNNNMERLEWFNHEIIQQFQRALPNQDGIMFNNAFREAIRYYLGMSSFILGGFADGNHFTERNKAVVDPYGIAVKNAMLMQGDYISMHDDNGYAQESQSMGCKGAPTHVSSPCSNRIPPPILRRTADDERFHHS